MPGRVESPRLESPRLESLRRPMCRFDTIPRSRMINGSAFAAIVVGLIVLVAASGGASGISQDTAQLKLVAAPAGDQSIAADQSQNQSEQVKFSAEQIEFYEKSIRPVLAEKCFSCHSSQADELSGGLNLESRASAIQGGFSGAAIVPGMPDESYLVQAIRYSGDFYDMPPEGKLPDDVIADLERWVAIGAPAPSSDAATSPNSAAESANSNSRNHWSFQPVSQPRLPDVHDADWPADDIDRFILSQLEAAKLSPAGDAEPRNWLRRVYLDLIGLPPAPDETAAFLREPSQQARIAVVDRLLDSPAFGERWGRHWLDVVRYADSTGGGRTRLLPNAWRFRDYVIDSLNADRPFDEFVRQHVAGDLLPATDEQQQRENIIATSFLSLGPFNYEKQDKEQLRMDVVDEQLDTIGKAFLGLTFGCARCHDHKFDPITATDYYAMAGVLRNTQTLVEANVSNWIERELALTPEEQVIVNDVQLKIADVDGRIAAVRGELKEVAFSLAVRGYTPDGAKLGGIIIDDALAQRRGAWKNSTSVKPYVGAGYVHDDNTSKGKKSLTFALPLPASGRYAVRLAYTHGDNRATDALVIIRAADGEHTVRLNQQDKPKIENRFQVLGEFDFDDQATVVVSNAETDGYVIVDAVQFVALSDSPSVDLQQDSDDEALIAGFVKQSARLLEKIATLQTDRDSVAAAIPAASKAMSVREETTIEDCAVMAGGDVHRPAEIVPRGVPAILSEFAREIPPTASGRLQLAEWIANPRNPFTARVMVNRVWGHLFGQGIVPSVDNLGVMGNEPSHPELLDHLANEFVDSGWSTKAVIRRIVLSRTYAMGYAANGNAEQLDPENRLLWRANRRRLDAEVLRDTMLAVAGSLEPSAGEAGTGGPAFPPDYASELEELPRRNVRSVYLPVFRNAIDPFLDAFDFGNPGFVSGRREMSTRPSQALYFMNSPFIEAQSEKTAHKLLAVEATDRKRLLDLFKTALCRPPTQAEQSLLLEAVQPTDGRPLGAEERLSAWTDVARAVFSSVDFRFVE